MIELRWVSSRDEIAGHVWVHIRGLISRFEYYIWDTVRVKTQPPVIRTVQRKVLETIIESSVAWPGILGGAKGSVS